VTLPGGRIKQSPEDFIVDELPAYEPSGTGEHLFVRFRKTNLTTDDAVRALAESLHVDRREIGVAGLKDKVAVTTQWISIWSRDASLDERVAALGRTNELAGIEILEHQRHSNKLKTGHLKGNQFTITLRAVEAIDVPRVVTAFDRIAKEGVPNAFGHQRFGRDADNHVRARAWLTGHERPPRDARLRRLHFSALQSSIINAVLEERIKGGTWNTPVLGDLLKKEDTGGIFVCTDVQLDRERAIRGELCPTGPIVGDRMRQPEAEAGDLEQRIVAPLIEGIDLHRARALGEGTRRALRLHVTELSHAVSQDCGRLEGRLRAGLGSSLDEATSSEDGSPSSGRSAIKVRFVLPKGAYATTVLGSAVNFVDAARQAPEEE
jgi:tRNA pseudouridine13 synthase